MMAILLAFAPFILFVVIQRLMGVTAGLVSSTIVSAALLGRSLMNPHKSVKILEVGTVILFGVLALYAYVWKVTWPIAGVRLRVDTGLLLVVLVSIALRRP